MLSLAINPLERDWACSRVSQIAGQRFSPKIETLKTVRRTLKVRLTVFLQQVYQRLDRLRVGQVDADGTASTGA